MGEEAPVWRENKNAAREMAEWGVKCENLYRLDLAENERRNELHRMKSWKINSSTSFARIRKAIFFLLRFVRKK